ncbi:hypothetical protein DNTS_012144 [Danionella cerebrum]|uniref:Centrosomal protein of 162 kDa n=1 Tax=Danionella cerebrum TaxID=2873325 RepID=A0A553Q8W4_9TELE|nr:hypothetical protein DNTS_012144 [Danionella translucida]
MNCSEGGVDISIPMSSGQKRTLTSLGFGQIMAHRLTKEELDQQFEQFLKESVSDDSVDLGSGIKHTSVLDSLGKAPVRPVVKKPSAAVPWWQDDDDSEEGTVPSKPTPKPRSIALDKVNQLSVRRTPRADRQNSPGHESMDEKRPSPNHDNCSDKPTASEKEDSCCASTPVSEKSSNSSVHKGPIDTASNDLSVESTASDSENGMSTTGKSFRKSFKKTPSIKEVNEGQSKDLFLDNEGNRDHVVLSRDSLEPEESLIMVASAVGQGLSTLDEDDISFLSNLKKGCSSSVDFSKTNKEQEPSSPTCPQRGEMDSGNEEEQRMNKDTAASPAYSDDFDEEVSEKSDKAEPELKVVPSLALGIDKHAELLEPPALSYGQSGGSEMEALQEAYRQINSSAGGCEEGLAALASKTSLSVSTLQLPSTVESDLPTAEELMQHIKPDSGSTRGFSLQPIIEALPQRSRSQSPLRISSDENPFSPANEDCGGWKTAGLTGVEPSASFQTQKSISEEIKCLMQEQDISSVEPPLTKPKKQQVPARSNVLGYPSSRKAPIPSARMKKAESRPLPRIPAPNRTSQAAKLPSPLTERRALNQATKKTEKLNQTQTVRGLDASLGLSSELVASVQSIAAFLQHQAEVSTHRETLPPNKISPKIETVPEVIQEKMGGSPTFQQERASFERFRLQLAQKERELSLREDQLREEHKQELAVLRQENYVLKSKLHRTEEANKKRKWSFGDASDPVTEEKLRVIEKEMKEQETLIQGYHQENEKLYLQMKVLQAQSKQSEEALFTENQRLLAELGFLREQVNTNTVQRSIRERSVANQSFSMAELMSQVHAAQKKEERLQEEIRLLKQEKQALFVDLEIMRKERDRARVQAVCTSGDKGFELKMLQEKHQEEVTELKKRLQWYAENQELLDKDASRLQAATTETQKLTEQVEKLKMEVNRRANEHQRKAKERSSEEKKIQDLERQASLSLSHSLIMLLKQMEELLKRRHPNSLPALILAAASSGAKNEHLDINKPVQSTKTAALLERRVQRLEAELENHDEAAKRTLRTMEQQFHRIKLQYEQQISDLEQRLTEKSQPITAELSASQTQSQQAELEEVKKTHQEQLSRLQGEVASLQEQLAQSLTQTAKPSRSPSRHQLQAEAAQATRIERLTQELNSKSRTIQELSRTVDRLQRERRTMLSGPGLDSMHKSKSAKDDKQLKTETFPPTQDEKDYHPGAFSGSHISEVQLENDGLRTKLEQLEVQREQEKASLQAAVSHAQSQLLGIEEQNSKQLASIKAEHRKEIERLLARHALEHSSSKVAELTSQLNTQEIIVQHLQGQVKELQGFKDALAVSKLREETLQNQLSKLLEELKEAKDAHSPELKHFINLEQKIQSMELRYDQREKQLQQVIANTRRVVEQEQQGELERWKRLAQGRAKELEVFRLELDSILDVLRELQRQGVVVPVPEHTTTSMHTYLPLRS